MNSYFKRLTYIYLVLSIIFIIISFIIFKRTSTQLSYLRLSIGALLISAILDFSVVIFKTKKLPPIINILLGFISLIPAIYVFKEVFGALMFKVSIAIYIFAFVCAVIYSIAVIIISYRVRKDEQFLNKLLKEKKNTENE
ncbi:MAG: hypothetical protein PHT83_02675 [Bacilli bacterium]|nr:hypothetical protein [Bacilli bacterium]